jgi:cellulose synthase/poly-beta-1,6-N-acetylglucosamine synthase-like glycosyltransferase
MFAHSFFVISNRLFREAMNGAETTSLMMIGLVALYGAILIALSIHGSHRYLLLWRQARARRAAPQAVAQGPLPGVTVQLPLYNERLVVRRLLRSVAELDYPQDRLQIQILDDSTDSTSDVVDEEVRVLAGRGFDVQVLRRADRTGYKAGALASGLRAARHDLIAIFDADFTPRPDFLKALVGHFEDPQVGAVQARWGHLNGESSLLTRLQGLMLDGHFLIEHPARSRSGLFFNFNGTGGIWRRQAVLDAGGWDHDTLTEDLDLSYRAQVRGWRLVYREDVICPAEVPDDMNAFKAQQHRWAKGSVQTMRKILPRIWRAALPLRVKAEATIHLTGNLCYLLILPLLVLSLPMLILRARIADGWTGAIIDQTVFACGVLSMLTFYTAALLRGGGPVWRRLHLPFLMLALGTGLSVNQARAVLEGFGRSSGEFVRTPKWNLTGDRRSRGATGGYVSARNLCRFLELAFALYFTVVVALAVRMRLFGTLPFLGIFFVGFWYVTVQSFRGGRPAPRVLPAPAAQAAP